MNIDEESVFEFVKASILDMKDIASEEIQIDSLLEDIDLDSLDYIDLLVSICRKYRVNLDPEWFVGKHITTMRELASHVVDEMHRRDALIA